MVCVDPLAVRRDPDVGSQAAGVRSLRAHGVGPSAIESLTAPAFLASAAEDEGGALAYLRHGSENLRRAAAAGVPIALGTDVNNPFVFPGYSAHEELALMVRAGLTPAQALRAATAGGAAFLRASDRMAAIALGFDADFILLSRNPLDRIENSRSIVAVIADGRAGKSSAPANSTPTKYKDRTDKQRVSTTRFGYARLATP